MSQSIDDRAYDLGQPRGPWRQAIAILLQLTSVAMAALAVGIYVFPIQ